MAKKEIMLPQKWISTPFAYTQFARNRSLLQQDVLLKVSAHLQDYLAQYYGNSELRDSPKRPKPLFSDLDKESGLMQFCVNFAELGVAPNNYPAVKKAVEEVLSTKVLADVVDKETGKPVYNAIVWQCRRTAAMCEELKAQGLIRKIIVTGCLSQRYQKEMPVELPEVDGLLGTANYGDIVTAVNEVMSGEKCAHFSDINGPVEELPRLLSTPVHYAYLRIAEGCSNRCAYCVIPQLRGKYRSRPMEDILAEAKALADEGVKECIVIAQDITRYGIDLYKEKKLPELLTELCKLNFAWIRLHYLYPDTITPELIDTIAREEKICKYIDMPIQHCSDKVLGAMRRRETHDGLVKLITEMREKIPGLVLRTSLITGLPYEDEAAFEELCEFLKEARIERAGVFPFSPEEGTPAAAMEHVDYEIAERRADLILELQAQIMDDFCNAQIGKTLDVLCEGFDEEIQMNYGRSYADSPDIDGQVFFDGRCEEGTIVKVKITDTDDGNLIGTLD